VLEETLFNLITGLLQPSSGQLLYQGEELTKLRPHQIAAKGIARTFQNIRLFGSSRRWKTLSSPGTFILIVAFTGVLGLPPAPTEELKAKQRLWSYLNGFD